MKILLIGSDGQAGRALQASKPSWADVQLATEAIIDIRDKEAVSDLVTESGPDVIINAAAYTDVDKAEADKEMAYAVNAIGAENLAIAANNGHARMCHISTDYVFDMDRAVPLIPDHECNPANVYGHSKRDGEIRVLETMGDSCVIIRTSWLYYQGGKNFVETMLRIMAEKESVRVVADQFGAPTWAATLANAIWSAVHGNVSGVHHWRDAGVASWYDFAAAIAEIGYAAGLLDKKPDVLPISSDEFPTKARRPVFSLLDTKHTEHVLGLTPQHWRLELTRMMEQSLDA